MNYYPASAGWVYIGYNIRNEMLKDVRVRQALAHMMDRKKVIEAIRLGHAADQLHLRLRSWAFSDDVPKYDYEVAKAKSLLDAAGWRRRPTTPTGRGSRTASR